MPESACEVPAVRRWRVRLVKNCLANNKNGLANQY